MLELMHFPDVPRSFIERFVGRVLPYYNINIITVR